MLMNLFGIEGAVETPAGITEDEFNEALMDFFESKGWFFGGGTWQYKNEGEDTNEAYGC